MNKIKAILFDNDGVLAHTEQYWFDADRRTLQEMGLEYRRQDFVESNFVTGQGTRGWLATQGYEQAAVDQFTLRRDDLWQKMTAGKKVTDPHALPVLQNLSRNYQIGVVTNSNLRMFAHLHEKVGFDKLFDILVLREDYARPKPDPDAYLAALDKLKLPPDRALAVEDSPRGIQAACNAGIKVVSIPNPDFTELDQSMADHHIEKLTHLPGLLATLNGQARE